MDPPDRHPGRKTIGYWNTRMISWIKGLFGGRTANEAGRHNPVLAAAVQKSAQIFEETPLRDLISDAEREALARELYLEINRISNANDPSAACRDSLAETMLKFARYQVLVIPPQPEADPSGLRAQPGISGELSQHLVEVARRAENLRTDLYGMSGSATFDNVSERVQALYWKTFWRLESINATRIELGDHILNNDWYLPFKHAACASAEHVYRHLLELPPAFEEDIAKPVSTAYSIYTDIVVSGAADPDSEWRDYYKDSNIPVPHFENH
jgi:hypothetical protein